MLKDCFDVIGGPENALFTFDQGGKDAFFFEGKQV